MSLGTSPNLEFFLPESISDAQDFLDSALTEEDLERLQGIRFDLNAQIRWKELLKESFPALMLTMQTVLFEGSGNKDAPVDSLFPVAQNWLDEPYTGEVKQHYLTLLFLKKLLGVLKTKVNQELDSIPQISYEQEMDLKNYVRGQDHEQELLEEQMLSHRFSSSRQKSLEEEETLCRHTRVSITHHRQDGRLLRRGYCKDCRQVVSAGPLLETKKAPCKHPYVEWVEGQEGKIAQCSKEECRAVIPDPEKFRWMECGLEPFGDDPQQDEVIVLNKEML